MSLGTKTSNKPAQKSPLTPDQEKEILSIVNKYFKAEPDGRILSSSGPSKEEATKFASIISGLSKDQAGQILVNVQKSIQPPYNQYLDFEVKDNSGNSTGRALIFAPLNKVNYHSYAIPQSVNTEGEKKLENGPLKIENLPKIIGQIESKIGEKNNPELNAIASEINYTLFPNSPSKKFHFHFFPLVMKDSDTGAIDKNHKTFGLKLANEYGVPSAFVGIVEINKNGEKTYRVNVDCLLSNKEFIKFSPEEISKESSTKTNLPSLKTDTNTSEPKLPPK